MTLQVKYLLLYVTIDPVKSEWISFAFVLIYITTAPMKFQEIPFRAVRNTWRFQETLQVLQQKPEVFLQNGLCAKPEHN